MVVRGCDRRSGLNVRVKTVVIYSLKYPKELGSSPHAVFCPLGPSPPRIANRIVRFAAALSPFYHPVKVVPAQPGRGRSTALAQP